MADKIGYSVDAGVAVLSIRNPPGNALSQAVRESLMDALDSAEEDEAVRQILLIGEGQTFPAGADLNEFDKGIGEPTLRDLCERVEYCEKPVVAALHGTVYGAGFELALSAHYRLAAKGTRLSLPDVRLGLPPSAGGSQRLPRLIGAKHALGLLLEGKIWTSEMPEARPLIDGNADGDLRQAGLRFCAVLGDKDQGPRRLSDETRGFMDMQGFVAAVAAAREDLPTGLGEAPARIVELVEAAALLPFEAGLAMEEDAFETCLSAETARGLRHSFVSEWRAARFELKGTHVAKKVSCIAVLGGGPLALQIALVALNSGLTVHWGTRDQKRAGEGADQIRQIFDQNVANGALSRKAADGHMRRLKTGESEDMVSGADLIVHAAPGQGNVPAPAEMVRVVAMPGRVDEVGLRFAPPVFHARMAEVVQGPDGTATQVAMAQSLVQRLGKVPVQVRSQGDSLVGRLSIALHRAVDGLVDKGADPYAIDDALRDWGWPIMPFQNRDLIGLAQPSKADRGDGGVNWSAILLKEGRKGQAAGMGFYRWVDGKAETDPQLASLLEAKRPSKTWKPDDLVAAVTGAVVNEGLRALDSGMAQRASDLDVVSVLGMQFPAWRGGIMKAVSLRGLLATQSALRAVDHPDQAFWTPIDLWSELIKNGKSFDQL
ncbi:enoyl-CoA hydratase/isomerase family protein [Thalassococcus lentus]|uniref:Enoyl-CoA hydratase-related protein n=1 Tax=Thalassococcus lentus TaxID=1210524 RepID=A0ABT4XUH1_9RHOB|nr:enoyl-CoA hydratase/isomerase family protein [Thalassococcus lentus]MDA7425582.1 enoyl-CoA hydratase-related protein [Thalassococcus lentus]